MGTPFDAGGVGDASAGLFFVGHGSNISYFPFSEKKEKVIDVPFWPGQISPIDPHHPHRLTIIFLLFI